MILLLSMVLNLAPVPEPTKEDAVAQAKADNAAFAAFFKENKLDQIWQKGDPIRRDTEAVRKAFGAYRAYYTFSPRPFGGRPKAYQQALADYQKNSLSVVVLIKDGKVKVLKNPEDFNTGLMPIKTEEDARTAAAAIMSLLRAGEVAPQSIEAKNVKATHENGWTCTCRVGTGVVSGAAKITFDDQGRCNSIDMPKLMLPRTP